ncbi:MAG: methyltransferase [Pseudomonadota bacterium]
MTAPETAELTCNDFLGGALRIWQPRTGYRAGIDPVLLAASVPAKPGESVLDLGCGAFVAGLCLARRVPGLNLTGLERHPDYATLAKRNAADNDLAAKVVIGDLADIPPTLRDIQFDHVLANPPYFDRRRGKLSQSALRESALGEVTPLEHWVRQAAKRTRPGGTVTMIQRADRLPDLIKAAPAHLGSIEVLPLLPRIGRSARLILIRGRPGGQAAFRLHAGIVLHEGENHGKDAENYTPNIARILRKSGELQFPQ